MNAGVLRLTMGIAAGLIAAGTAFGQTLTPEDKASIASEKDVFNDFEAPEDVSRFAADQGARLRRRLGAKGGPGGGEEDRGDAPGGRWGRGGGLVRCKLSRGCNNKDEGKKPFFLSNYFFFCGLSFSLSKRAPHLDDASCHLPPYESL